MSFAHKVMGTALMAGLFTAFSLAVPAPSYVQAAAADAPVVISFSIGETR